MYSSQMTFHATSVFNLLQKKQNIEGEREAMVRKPVDLDTEIIKTQAEYGQLCNRNASLLALRLPA
jgi:hypothetical protein